jgi:hypothetical protein
MNRSKTAVLLCLPAYFVPGVRQIERFSGAPVPDETLTLLLIQSQAVSPAAEYCGLSCGEVGQFSPSIH